MSVDRSGSKWNLPTDGLKSVSQTDRVFRRDHKQVRRSLTLGQRSQRGLRERTVNLGGVGVNSLLSPGWI